MKHTDYLVLVNKDVPFDPAFLDSIELLTVPNVRGEEIEIEKETWLALCELVAALKERGVIAGPGGVFRTVEYQQSIMDRFTREKGADYARKFVAIPGRSEHHTGLAVDLLPYIDGAYRSRHEELFAAGDIFAKVHPILPDFGFILRYPADKESVTGISYEPWHIRFVGKKAAREITERGLCLEEYLAGRTEAAVEREKEK